MIIEMYGAAFENKGAQLMLETAMRQVRERFPCAEFCIEQQPRMSLADLRGAGLKTFFPTAPTSQPRRQALLLPLSDMIGRLTPSFVLSRRNLVARNSVDALIDISGYAFGDVWGLGLLRGLTQRARYYSQRGRPVIMLPQVLGPFDSPPHREAMRELLRWVDLIYARDTVSLQHMQNRFANQSQKVRLAPDITIFAEPDPEFATPAHPYACIVPNVRILEKGPINWREHYIVDLVRAARLLREHGIEPILLIHETVGDDLQLAQEIQRQAALPTDAVFQSPSPLRLKEMLGGAILVIASRFHAAVSALSSGVPTVVLGWAHKYDELMEDFGTAHLMYDADQGWPELEAKLLGLTDDDVRAATQAILRERKEQMRPVNEQMWHDVFAILATKT